MTQAAFYANPNQTRIPGTNIATEWRLVTPEMAEEMLEKNTRNRKINWVHVERLAESMRNGTYEITHEGVAFISPPVGEEYVGDAQHRLLGVVESGCPQWLLVTVGLRPESQPTMDGGNKRGLVDFMGDIEHYRTAISAAFRMIHAMRAVAPDITESRINALMKRMDVPNVLRQVDPRDKQSCVALAKSVSTAAASVPTVPMSCLMAAVVFLIDDWDVAKEYLQGFDLVGLPEGDPRIALVRRRKAPGAAMHQRESLSLALRTTEAWLQNRSMKLIRAVPSNQPLVAPELIPRWRTQPEGLTAL